MKVWLFLVTVAFLQLFVLNQKVDATTFDLPLNGEFEITGDISAPTWITFTAVGTSIPAGSISSNNPPGASWLYSIVLTQSDAPGGFSTPQVCGSNGGCFLLSNFLGCGGIGCSESNAQGYGYVRNGAPAPILVSDQTDIFTVSTSTSGTPFDLDFTVDLPDGLGIDELQGPTLDAAVFAPQIATPNPDALPLFVTGLLILVLFGWRKRHSGLPTP